MHRGIYFVALFKIDGMIRSMTGYGKAVAEIRGRRLTLEIKTLNSKQNDLNLKLPAFLRERELELRTLLTQQLDRGKIDVFVTVEITPEALPASINKTLAMKYYRELKELLKEFREDCPGGLLPLVVRMPDVLQQEREDLADTEWGVLRAAFEEAIRQADAFRVQEGKVLENDMVARIGAILSYLDAVEPFEQQRTEKLRENIRKSFEKFGNGDTLAKADPNRFEQELIYYLEKLDFTEEKVRLRKHCEHFRETLGEEGHQGKKLGFITQEIGREINTLGSKANDAGIQRLVVQMKDELEKVKEQLLNIL
jgi:uncharacterized protein (TIGR00255 family)